MENQVETNMEHETETGLRMANKNNNVRKFKQPPILSPHVVYTFHSKYPKLDKIQAATFYVASPQPGLFLN